LKTRIVRTAALFFVTTVLTVVAFAQDTKVQGHWVSAWSTAIHTPLAFPGMPPLATFDNQTIRMVIRPTIGGQRLRIRFSNELGSTPLAIGGAHIALAKENGSIVPNSDRPLTFAGEATVNIPAGAPLLSDPVELSVPAFAEIAVSIFLPKKSAPSTFHLLGQHATYISGPGNFTGAEDIQDAKVTKSWYWLAGLEFWTTDKSAVVVTFGDSITDGFGAKENEYGDWPNQLAKRLAEVKSLSSLAVDNEGIGGNRILYDGAGINALARLDRDVLSQPGVADLIVLEGINDIGWPHMKPFPAKEGSPSLGNPFATQAVTADDLIQGLEQIIDRAHEHGIRAFGATMTPYRGADYFSEDGEVVRQAVNQWIRTGKAFDGVFDFDAAVRDPNHPTQFREDLHSGDHLHPNSAGYKAMADSINLSSLQAK
jgi:lysophospholipase L1-like esterase